MLSAGRILIIPKGDYDESATYEVLDLVNHDGNTWIARKSSKGVVPSVENSEYWQKLLLNQQ